MAPKDGAVILSYRAAYIHLKKHVAMLPDSYPQIKKKTGSRSALQTSYIIISPVRDEEAFIQKTIESVIHQTIPPRQWVIVNDGSTDNTSTIVENYQKKHPWIKLVNRENRGRRVPGGGVVEAFYDGLKAVDVENWEYVVKLDGDLSFQAGYFEDIFARFKDMPDLGIASGQTYLVVDGRLPRRESCSRMHTRGASKVYKRSCFNDIGGIMVKRGWDTIDDMAARVKGYEARSFPELKLLHHRPMGILARKKSWVKNSRQYGEDYYQLGYHPIFMMLKCIKFMFIHKPFLLFGFNMGLHHTRFMVLNKEKIVDRTIVKKIRQLQIKRMLLIK
jgi:glycosyltransferase involved in cell wall biosynthesis